MEKELKERKYYRVNKKTLAETLNFMGFSYYKFNNNDGTVSYSFLNTGKFQKALTEIFNLRNKINN